MKSLLTCTSLTKTTVLEVFTGGKTIVAAGEGEIHKLELQETDGTKKRTSKKKKKGNEGDWMVEEGS